MDVLDHDGLRFEVRDEGPATGPPVILLHGFPGDPWTFERVLPLLHADGLRTIVLHQRGYSAAARPSDVASYAVPRLVGDVLALLDSAGLAAAHIVGHDWGGIVAWHLAGSHPDRVLSLTALSTPHPQAYRRALLRSTQLLRSWYAVTWQVPRVPEAAMLAGDGRLLRRALANSGLDETTARRYTLGMAEPGRLTAALNWYRAAGRRAGEAATAPTVHVPTTYMWSSGDVALGRRAADETERFVDGPYRFIALEGPPHWLPEVCPERTADAIIAQVRSVD
jgi:pimeloyl-ACP methyl ester carboxylesterase